MTVRVVVADDQALVRGSFRLLIETAPDLVTVGEAQDGVQAVEVVAREQPDVVLMDIRMPNVNGIDATRRIVAAPGSRAKVLILTTHDLDEYVYAALRAGASGFLLKDIRPAELLDAIRVVAAGDALLAPSVTRRLIREFTTVQPAPAPPSRALTDTTARERDVLVLVARGLSNAEISDRLQISVATVKTHVHRLLGKLAARDRAQLVILAYETGLVTAQRRD
jgi:DNA-binding NarL/FixJ family response regulator